MYSLGLKRNRSPDAIVVEIDDGGSGDAGNVDSSRTLLPTANGPPHSKPRYASSSPAHIARDGSREISDCAALVESPVIPLRCWLLSLRVLQPRVDASSLPILAVSVTDVYSAYILYLSLVTAPHELTQLLDDRAVAAPPPQSSASPFGPALRVGVAQPTRGLSAMALADLTRIVHEALHGAHAAARAFTASLTHASAGRVPSAPSILMTDAGPLMRLNHLKLNS